MPTSILARSKPFPDPLRANQRVCKRCGIKYGVNESRTASPHCRDCRDLLKPVPPCGTPEAYYRHIRHGEPRDEACRAWRAAKTAADRKARQENTTDCGTYPGYKRHKRHGTKVCEPCEEARRAYDNNYYQRKKTA